MHFTFEKRVAFCGARNAAIHFRIIRLQVAYQAFANITRDSVRSYKELRI